MQELSLNVLDIVQNSIKANASLITVDISKDTVNKTLTIKISDNGKGMDEEIVKKVIDPFFTTRTTRSVGLGIPFFKMTAEMTGGNFTITSELNKGTDLTAFYYYEHLDMLPLGDMASTFVSLISVNKDIDFVYTYSYDDRQFIMDTREIKMILDGAEIDSFEVLSFIKDFINENQTAVQSKE